MSNWEILEDKWVSTPDEDRGGITYDDKWLKVKCPECQEVEWRMKAWVDKHEHCGCVKVEQEVKAAAPVRVREPITLTVRRVGVMAGRRRVKVTDENERRVAAHFTIPVRLIRKLGDQAARERKSASEVVTELVRGYLDGPRIDGEAKGGVEAGQEVEEREGGL